MKVNVLGWEPRANRRWGEFFFGSKITSILYLLTHCHYRPETVVIMTDNDVLIQGGMGSHIGNS